MAYEITSESYGRRLPKITATADSTDDLASLGTNWAEGSTCAISGTTYKLDKVKGWVDPDSGGGGGSSLPTVTSDDNGDVLTVVEGEWDKAAPSGGVFVTTPTYDALTETLTLDKTWQEIATAYESGKICRVFSEEETSMSDWIVQGVSHTPTYGYDIHTANGVFTASSADEYPAMDAS